MYRVSWKKMFAFKISYRRKHQGILPFSGVIRIRNILINSFRLFSGISAPRNCGKVKFNFTSSTRKNGWKVAKILPSFGDQAKFDSYRSIKYCRCYEFLNVGIIFWPILFVSRCFYLRTAFLACRWLLTVIIL